MERILLADDNSNLRSALRLLLETRFDVKMIGEARDMENVLSQVESLHPDCIILDWELPGRPTEKRISALQALLPTIKVIALSARPESRQSALKDGADTFICKTESPTVILDQLHEIYQRKKSVD